MTNYSIIILLGHENHDNGTLYKTSKYRCEKAYNAFKNINNSYILPTGKFGEFNKTYVPHYIYLTNYLIYLGVPSSKILSGTRSSDTYEDCLCARKRIIDGNYQDVYFVTSDFHSIRVNYILYNIFPDIKYKIIESITPEEELNYVRKKEERSWKKARQDVREIPLYKGEKNFPSEIYENAANEHKHYDNISLAILTATLLIMAYLMKLWSANISDQLKSNFIKFSIGIDIILLSMYWQCYKLANIARRTMHLIEISFDRKGFSCNPRSAFNTAKSPRLRNCAILLILYFMTLKLILLYLL